MPEQPTPQVTDNQEEYRLEVEPTATSTNNVKPENPTPATLLPATTMTPPTLTVTTTIRPPTETPQPTDAPVSETVAPIFSRGVSVTHQDIIHFRDIPDEFILAASQFTWLFRHASVGVNILDGLDCLMNNFERRPHRCDRDLAAEEIIYDPKYDHRNWRFELHSPPPNPNPGWWNKVNFFVNRLNNLAPNEQYDFASFKLGYVDAHQGSNVSRFFDADHMPNRQKIATMQSQLDDTTIIWWSLALARLSFIESEEFNEQLRVYIAANDEIFMDIADIMSHDPQGQPCFDNAGNGVIALCPNYTDEVNGGHLNARGRARMAQAVWILMARLAGWDG